MPFLFTNAFLLAALAALGIPVLIHLLLKRKSQRLRFSTIRFFVRQEEQASARRKLRNLLLLALRLLILALIVFAFARPYLPETNATATARPRRQVVLVLDRSLSLQAVDSGGSRWAQARERAREFLATLESEDRVALVTCAGPAIVTSGFAQPTVVAQLVADQVSAAGAGDLADGLREAARLIALGDPNMLSSIVVISDLQRSGTANLGAVALPVGLEVQILPVGDLAAPNIAVAELNLEPVEGVLPHAVLVHHGDEDIPALDTELRVDGKPVLARILALEAGAATNLDLSLPALKPGWHDVEFRAQPRDSLTADDVRYQTLWVPEPVRVGLVEGRSRKRSFEEQTFFVAAALDPAFGTTNASVSRFALEKMGPNELPGRLREPGGTRPVVVILPALRSLSGEAKRVLLEFVQAGGGLLIFLGEEISANGFNSDFGGLSPASLRSVETVSPEASWRLGERDLTRPWFAPFGLANSGNLSLPQFTGRFTVVPSEKGTVSARFEDGVPLVVGGEIGLGRVLLVNTSADTTWNDWPKHKTFVPWLRQVVQYLAGQVTAAELRAGASLEAGSPEELELGKSAQNAQLRLVGTGGQEMTVTADSQGRLDLKSLAPGIWTLRDAAGQELRRISVNVPASEADLAAIRPGEFQQQLVREVPQSSAELTANLFGSSPRQREFWRLLLLCAFTLLVVETLYSNRSSA